MHKIKVIGALCASLAVASFAGIQEKRIEYKQENTTLEGYIVFDDAIKNKAPGVLVVHDWMGVSEDTKQRAHDLAKQGYVAFVADIYGKGVRPQNASEAGKQATIYKTDRSLLRARANAALNELKKSSQVDVSRIAAIGFCFGGTTVLELARSGADLKGVVSFHGGLDSPKPEDGKNIKAKVLVLHGSDDPFIKAEDLQKFNAELKANLVDYQFISYSQAVHAFTVKGAGNDPSKGAAYNPMAEKRAFGAMNTFFNEIFAR